MKKIICLMLVVCMIFCMAACGKSPAAATHNVTDHAGNIVAVPDEINRIAVCDIYPLPAMLCTLFGESEKIVAMAPQSMAAAKSGLLGELYPEVLSASTGFLQSGSVNIEELLALMPDVVFYSVAYPETGEKLKQAGVAAVAVSANKWEYDAIETTYGWGQLIGEVLNKQSKAQLIYDYSKSVYNLVQQKTKDVKNKQDLFFLFQYTETGIMTASKNSFGNWWANAVGANNVAADLTNNNGAPTNMEQIYKYNPSKILITNFTLATPDDIKNNTVGNYDWKPVKAVKNGEIYKMPLGSYRSYTAGIDTPITLLWLAKKTYPDLFKNVDIKAETKGFYKDVMDIELTNEQINKMF